MPEVNVMIGGRNFQLACEAGEEPHLEAAAKLLDVEAQTLAGQAGRLTESRMLLMAGLMLADKSKDIDQQVQFSAEKITILEQQLQAADAKIASLVSAAPKAFPGAETLKSYEDAVMQLESLAERLEG